MKEYNISSPFLAGLLTDDHLYFEGVSRPSEIYLIKDEGGATDKELEILEKYFNDVYNLFLRKISVFAILDKSSDEDSTKIQALLQELIKVKDLIIKSSEGKYKDLV